MWEKIERYSSYCMVLGTVLFIATIGAAVGCVLGFALCQRLGLDGTLQDFFVFAFGLFGFVVTCYYVKRVISWFEIIAGTLFFMLILFSLVIFFRP